MSRLSAIFALNDAAGLGLAGAPMHDPPINNVGDVTAPRFGDWFLIDSFALTYTAPGTANARYLWRSARGDAQLAIPWKLVNPLRDSDTGNVITIEEHHPLDSYLQLTADTAPAFRDLFSPAVFARVMAEAPRHRPAGAGTLLMVAAAAALALGGGAGFSLGRRFGR